MTKKRNEAHRPWSTVREQQFAKAKPLSRNMQGQSKRATSTRGRKYSVMPEISAAQHLLQLCVESSKSFDKDFVGTPKLKEEKDNNLKSHCMGSIDKSRIEDVDHDDEDSKSDTSYITDDQTDMETTLAEISAAQQMMELSNSYQQATAEEEEEESSGYKSDLSASSVVASKRKDFEESSAFLPRKRKFRSLAELYEITRPLEDPYFD